MGGVGITKVDVPVSTVEISTVTSTTAPKTQEVKTVKEVVREYFKDTPIMAEIAWCESRNRQFDINGEIFRGKVNSDDVGVMQINTYYHLKAAKARGNDLFTLEGNLDYAKYLFEREGTVPWMSSSKCWIPRSNLVALK